MAKHVVATVSEIKPGGRKLVDVKGRAIVLFNLGGEFFALSNRCPHQGGSLGEGILTCLVESSEPGDYRTSRHGEILRCPWHQWEYDIRTGKSWVDPRTVRVRNFPITVEPGARLVEGPYVAETFPVSVEDEYVVVDVGFLHLRRLLRCFAHPRPPSPAWCPVSTGDHANEVPRYDHILVIIAENHGYAQIIGNANAPNLNRLAKAYGSATQFYGEVHPSKANYIAMLGGDTFGIHDDDAYYCRAGSTDRDCEAADRITPYVDHTVTARSLADQLTERHLTWKGYYESIPEPGSKVVFYPDDQHPVPGQPTELYAVKHNGFMQFRAVQDDPALATRIVGFDQLDRDLASDQMPNYAHIVPNQCNEMHGHDGPNTPSDCRYDNEQGRIARGDRAIGALVDRIQASPIWPAPGNTAVVITWDEDEDPPHKTGTQGCCGYVPNSTANFGGGHIQTIVITNHGPRGVADDTPYNHYSLLRTTEDAFCMGEYLGHAADTAAGVTSMVKLFK